MENSAAMKIFVGSSIRGEARNERDKTDDYFYKLGDELRLRGAQLRLFGCITWDNRMRAEGSQKALNAMVEGSDAAVFMLAGDVGEYTREEINIALAAAKKSGKPKVYIFAKKIKSTSEGQKKVKQVKDACADGAEFFEYAEFDEIKGRLRDVVRKDGGQASMALQALAGEGKSAQGGYKAFDARDRLEEVKTSSIIYVFISSALNKAARTKLCNEIRGIGLIFEDVFKVLIVPVTCDYGSLDAQKAIDEAVGKGDICCFVFDGEYKKEDSAEFDKACELMKSSLDKRGDGAGNIKPRIYCFFTKGRCDRATKKMRERIADEYKHYYEEYSELARVQYRVIMSVIDLIGAACGMSENGLIYAGDKVLFSAGFLPEFFNNKKLEEAEKKFIEARRKYEELKFLHENAPSPETEREFAKAAESYKRLKDELEYLRASIMNASLRLVHTADGEILREEAEAREKFLRGDLDGANNAISVSQIMERAHAGNEESKRRNLAYIHALLFKAEVIESCTYESEEEQGKARRECYRAIKKIAEDGNVGCDGILAYLKYLLKYEEDDDFVLRECLDQAEIFDGKRSYLDITDEYRADIHIVLGEAYLKKGDFSKAQEEINKAIEAYTILAKDMPTIKNKIAEAYLLLAQTADKQGDIGVAADNYMLAGKIFSRCNSFIKAVTACEQAYAIYDELAKKDPAKFKSSLADVCMGLGVLFINVSKYAEAEEYCGRSYKIFAELMREKPETFKPYYAVLCMNMGVLYMSVRQYDKANGYYKQAYDIYCKLINKDPEAYKPEHAKLCVNMGGVYTYRNEYDEAVKYLVQALKIYVELTNKDREAYEPDYAKLCMNMGALYMSSAEYNESKKYYEQALKIYVELIKKDREAYNSDYAKLCMNMGLLYMYRAEYNEAIKYYEQALKIYVELTNEDQEIYEPDYAKLCMNMGALYMSSAEYNEAIKYYEQAYKIYVELINKNREAYYPEYATLCMNMGILYMSVRQYDKANGYYKQAYDIYCKLINKDPEAYNPNYAKLCVNMGLLYMYRTEYNEAKEWYMQAYDIYERLIKKDIEAYNPDYAKLCMNMGSLCTYRTEYDKAKEWYMRAYDIYERLIKKDIEAYKPDYAKLCMNMGGLYTYRTEYNEAIKYYEQAHKIYVELIKKDIEAYYPEYATLCMNMGVLYMDVGEYDKAEKYYKQAYEISTRLAEKNPAAYKPDLAISCVALGELYAYMKKYKEAQDHCRQAAEIVKKIKERGGSAEELEQNVKELLEMLNEEE